MGNPLYPFQVSWFTSRLEIEVEKELFYFSEIWRYVNDADKGISAYILQKLLKGIYYSIVRK